MYGESKGIINKTNTQLTIEEKMKSYIPLRQLLVIIMLFAGTMLSATTVYVTVNGVYHSEGDISVRVVAADMFGTNANTSRSPSVYCCGQQIITWEYFPFNSCNATFTVTQDDRSVTVSGVYVWDEMPWTNVTVTLPSIPNFPHKMEN